MQTQTAHMEQNVEFQQSFSPLLMQANHILSLSQTELEAAINEAIDENPALELEDCVVCPVCGRRTGGEPCATCRSALREAPTVTGSDEALPRSETEYRAPSTADPDFDPMTLIASAMDVREQILESAMASVADAQERGIALVLVDAIAIETGTSQEDVGKVLQTIQEIAPPGVGARSLQESLLLQVDYLRAEGVDVPDIVKRVIEDHLEELGSKRIARIARTLGVDPAEVEAVQSFIRDQLTPHPLQSH